jgi:hypothetical protein
MQTNPKNKWLYILSLEDIRIASKLLIIHSCDAITGYLFAKVNEK